MPILVQNRQSRIVKRVLESGALLRFGSALFLVALGACAHESNRRATGHAPSMRAEARAERSSLPTSEPAVLAPDDAALGVKFQATSALTTLEGEASYYSDRLSGHRTASGERYRPSALTAAHRSLPFGTVLRVTRSDGQASVYVRITDRGPYGSGRRILDLSRAAFQRLARLGVGVLEVRAEVVGFGPKRGN